MTKTTTPAEPLTIGFVVKGAVQNPLFSTVAGTNEFEGEITVLDYLASFADIVEGFWQDLCKTHGDHWCDFVWDYEVTEELGCWLISVASVEREWPDIDQIQQKIAELVNTAMPGTVVMAPYTQRGPKGLTLPPDGSYSHDGNYQGPIAHQQSIAGGATHA